MSSWNGNLLRVDLTKSQIEAEQISQATRLDYLGGRGLNSKILLDEVKAHTEALSPDNVLIFGAGALTSRRIPGATRFTVTARSPLTGILGDGNAGMKFGIELKGTGYDHIVFKGKAEHPVYLWIDGAKASLRDARHLWGKTTWETEAALHEELGNDVAVASIGPAGENLVRFACIINYISGANGRSGMGAVMGSKNLKAVVVRGGGKSFSIARPEELKRWIKRIEAEIKSSAYYPKKHTFGTTALTATCVAQGIQALKNNQGIVEPGSGVENLYHTNIVKYFTKNYGCPGCFIRCRHDTRILDGPYKGEQGGKIEYAAISSFGGNIGNFDINAVLKLNNLCNQYGVDVFTAGQIMGHAMEWYEKGLITKSDTDGIDLTWGNWRAVIDMLGLVSRRKGFGNILAEGPVGAAKLVGGGAEKYITHSKGMDWGGAEDVRPLKGFALCLATSTRGADHCRGLPWLESYFGLLNKDLQDRVIAKCGADRKELTNPLSYKKAGLIIYYQDVSALADSLGLCHFTTERSGAAIRVEDMAELFYLVTGIPMDEATIQKAARRIFNVERVFGVREGISGKDDYLQGKLGTEPMPAGINKGERLDFAKFTQMLAEYYALRGWDAQGIPTGATLESYGLGKFIDQVGAR